MNFLKFLLNELVDILEKETKGTKEHSSPPEKIPNGIHVPLANGVRKEPLVTWVHKNFQVYSYLYYFSFYLAYQYQILNSSIVLIFPISGYTHKRNKVFKM